MRKNIFFKIEHDCKLLRTSRWRKLGFWSKKFSSGFLQQEFALPKKSFEEKWFPFRKRFFNFSVIISGVWVISLSFLQNSLVRCVKPPISVLREIKWGNYPGKIVFSINFEFEEKKLGFSAKQWGMVLKTVAHLCSWPFSEIFLEAKIFVWIFSVIERKHRISRGNVFSGLSKAHFKCSVQHFEKKMIKVNFTFCGLFRTVCVFFFDLRGNLVRSFKTIN